MAIPKKIHYCWFGNGEKSALVEKCIASWRKFCPDCEIIEWNETNYDVTKNTYMYEAYQANRWGFVSDYARLDIIYEHGGIYLDTDVELVREIDKLWNGTGYMGFEKTPGASDTVFYVNTGQGFGAQKNDSIIKKMLSFYDTLSFKNADGSVNLTTCPYYNTEVLKSEGLRLDNTMQTIGDITIYPTDYFCPLDWKTRRCVITPNTYSIHRFDASWLSDAEKKKRKRQRRMDAIIHFPNRCIRAIVGKGRYEKLKNKMGR